MRILESKRLRKSLPHVRYGDVRSRIETGDIFLFRGGGPLSRFVSWGSGSAYSHVGLAVWWGERLFVFQAGARGVVLTPISIALAADDGRVEWLSVRPDLKPRLDREILLEAAQEELGRPAGQGVVLLALRLLLGCYRGSSRAWFHPPALFSSAYVSRCYRKAGLSLSPERGGVCTTPGDIAASEVLVHQGVIDATPEESPIHHPVGVTHRDVSLS